MSCFSRTRMALAIILLWTSPMPIGLTPGRLSRGINLHATKALRWSGLTQVVHKRFPTLARAEQRSLEDLRVFSRHGHQDLMGRRHHWSLGRPSMSPVYDFIVGLVDGYKHFRAFEGAPDEIWIRISIIWCT